MGHPERRYRRHELPPLVAWVRVGDEDRRQPLLDLSLGGALLGTTQLAPLGSELELLLAHASWREPLHVLTCVVHHRFAEDDPQQPISMGVEFLEFSGDGEERLSEVLAALEQGGASIDVGLNHRGDDSPTGRLNALRTEVRRTEALLLVLQREIDSYEAVDAQRRALTEHILLEHRLLQPGDDPATLAVANRLEQARAAIRSLEEALTQPVDPVLIEKATAEIVSMQERERQREEQAKRRLTELSERHAAEAAALDQEIDSQLLALEQLREGMARERHGWQVAINADLDWVTALEAENETLTKERELAACAHQTWMEGQTAELERLSHLAAEELATGQELTRRREELLAEIERTRAQIHVLTEQALVLSVAPEDNSSPGSPAPPYLSPSSSSPLATIASDEGEEIDLTDAAELAAPPPPERTREEFATRLLQGGRLRLMPAGATLTATDPIEAAVSVLLQQTDRWEELLAAAPPELREEIAARVFDLFRTGQLDIFLEEKTHR